MYWNHQRTQSKRKHAVSVSLKGYTIYKVSCHIMFVVIIILSYLSHIKIILMKAVVIIVAIVGRCHLSWFMTDRSVACCRPDWQAGTMQIHHPLSASGLSFQEHVHVFLVVAFLKQHLKREQHWFSWFLCYWNPWRTSGLSGLSFYEHAHVSLVAAFVKATSYKSFLGNNSPPAIIHSKHIFPDTPFNLEWNISQGTQGLFCQKLVSCFAFCKFLEICSYILFFACW